MACASAISHTSCGKEVRSDAQSRNVLRKPWTVASTPILRSVMSKAMIDSGFAGLLSRKYKLATATPRHIRQDCQGAIRQRHPMLPSGLHAFGRHGPQPTLEVYLGPSEADYLASASGGQDQEFKPT